jgi:predicted metal-dependent HD superfamily phosphohydrolase
MSAVEDLAILKDTWGVLCAATGVLNHELTFQLIALAYSGPRRHYHNAHHIAECLRELEPVRALCEEPLSVSAVLLFHDYVYEATRHDNEQRWRCARSAGPRR